MRVTKLIIIIIIIIIIMMIMIIIIIIIIIIILLLLIIIINKNNNNDNAIKNQVIWLKKCFLRICLNVFKLLVFFDVSGIWFQNQRPIKDKVFDWCLYLEKVVQVFRHYFLN